MPLQYLSPMACRFLRTTFFLTTIRTLRKTNEKININPGTGLEALAIKITAMPEEGRERCAEEMSIKTNLFYDTDADYILGLQQLDENKQYLPIKHIMGL